MSDPVIPGSAQAQPEEAANLPIAGEDALPGDALAFAPEVAPMESIANEPQIISTSSALPDLATTTGAAKPVLGSKTADVLLMYDSMLLYDSNTQDQREAELKKRMDLYAQYFLGGAELESFYGIDDFVARLQAYQTIRTLVMYIHGSAGVLETKVIRGGVVVNENNQLNQIAAKFQGAAPQVTYHVNFESCVVADNPSQLVEFKNLFQTPRVTGWNYFHMFTRWQMTLTGSVSADKIRGALQYPDEYLMLGTPHPVSYAGQAGTFEFLYEWFREDEDNSAPDLNPDRRVFVPRGEASTISLFSAQAACMEHLKNPEGMDLKTLCDPKSDEGRFYQLAQVTIRD